MILTVYLTLFALALGMIVLAYWKEKPFVQIFGYSLLFFLGAVLMNVDNPVPGASGGIEYKIGENINYTYNGTTLLATAQVDTYATYDNLFYGFLLTITSFFWMMVIVFDPKVKF